MSETLLDTEVSCAFTINRYGKIVPRPYVVYSMLWWIGEEVSTYTERQKIFESLVVALCRFDCQNVIK